MIRFSSLWSVCKFALFSRLSYWVCRFVAGDRAKKKKIIITLPSRRRETQLRISGPHEFCNDQFYLPYPRQDLSVHFEPGIYNMRLIYTLYTYPFFCIYTLGCCPCSVRNIIFHFLLLMACKFYHHCVFAEMPGAGVTGCAQATVTSLNPPSVGAKGEWKANLKGLLDGCSQLQFISEKPRPVCADVGSWAVDWQKLRV